MAPMVAKACSTNSSQTSPAISVQETGSRNKRKFSTDPHISDEEHRSGCDIFSESQDNSNDLSLDLGLSCALGPSEVVPSDPEEEIAATDELQDAHWSDLSESQLEELVLDNLDTILKSAIRQIVDFGYTEDIATKAVLRSGIGYGSKDAVTNIVDHAMGFLRYGQDLDPSREINFEDLHELEKYILAVSVCLLREVRPGYSTGDAMWRLLVCDMNVTLACAMDTDPFSSLVGDRAPNESPSASAQPQVRTEVKSSENLQNASRPNPSFACACQSETPTMASAPSMHGSQPKLTVTTHSNLKQNTGLVQEKEIPSSPDKSFVAAGKPNASFSGEKFCSSSKIPGVTKREYILRHKSLQLEKSYRTNGFRGASRSGKLGSFGGLILDKKLKPVEDSTGISVRNASKAMGADLPQDNLQSDLSTANALPPKAFNLETVKNTMSVLPKPNCLSTIPTINSQPALPAADTDLSLSLPTKSNCALMPTSFNSEAPNIFHSGLSNEKLSGQWVPQGKNDEMIINLVPKVRELQNQLQEWTEWANQKVMQAARRLSKDKAELKTLKQEKEEVERLKKEKQMLEESTMKKLSEMENALCKASGQVERANAAVCKLEVEKATLRKEMEAAKLQALESGASCQEVSKREKKTLTQIESWEKQKTLFQEEVVAEKRRKAQLQHEVEEAKYVLDQLEARWKQGERANEELVAKAISFRNTREQLEDSGKSKENMVGLKAEKNMQRYKDDIKKLEKEISQLRLKTDSSKIAALRRGVDGNYGSRLTDYGSGPTKVSLISTKVTDLQEHSGGGSVRRERECVMCLSEEMSVVFLPCAHMVVCTACNELHEKQGMMECPSCRGPIMRRVSVRHAPS